MFLFDEALKSGMCRIKTGYKHACLMVLFTLESNILNTQPHALFSIYTHSMTLSAKCFSSNRSVILLLVYFRLRGETEKVKHSSDILMSKTSTLSLFSCPSFFNVCLSLSLAHPSLFFLLVFCGCVLHKYISSTDNIPPW